MKVIAILDRSVGNESVGEMWQETASFSPSNTLYDVLEWASKQSKSYDAESFRGNLKLTVDQSK